MRPDTDLSLALRVDAACDRFEAEWRAGREPRIEDLLTEAAPAEHELLLEALVGIEWELRQEAGEPASVHSYLIRFPNHTKLVAAVLGESLRNAASETSISQSSSKTDPGEEARPLAKSEPLPERIGRFAVRQVVGAGAFGRVYRAFDPQLNRDVALKVPLAGSVETEGDRSRFLREARAAATIQHPNICPVYEVGEDAGRPYIVMALVPGQSLAAGLKSRTEPFAAKQAAIIVRKLALALEVAHRKGVIHRDLKPANVMFDRDRKDLIVMDFGLARGPRLPDARDTQSGVILGTPAYMSPEQARGDGKAVGPATDIYALGVILYELLAGRRPFSGTATEVIGQILHVEPQPPSKVRDGVDPSLEAICLRAIAKNPAARFASMRAFADELDKWMKGESSLLMPGIPDVIGHLPDTTRDATNTAFVPLKRTHRRWPAVLAVLLVSAMAVAAGVIYSLQSEDVLPVEPRKEARAVPPAPALPEIAPAPRGHITNRKIVWQSLLSAPADLVEDKTYFKTKPTDTAIFQAGKLEMKGDGPFYIPEFTGKNYIFRVQVQKKLAGYNLMLRIRRNMSEFGEGDKTTYFGGYGLWYNGGDASNNFGLGKNPPYGWRDLKPGHVSVGTGEFFEMALAAYNHRIIGYVNGRKELEVIDAECDRGKPLLSVRFGGHAVFRNLEVCSLDDTALTPEDVFPQLKPMPPIDEQRAAAEWVLRAKGGVVIVRDANGVKSTIEHPAAPPEQPFRIVGIAVQDNPRRLDKSGFTLLESLHELTGFCVEHHDLTDADVLRFGQMPLAKTCTEMDFHGPKLTDVGLESLAGWTNLTAINYEQTQATGVNLDKLKHLKLTKLLLGDTKVGDAAMAHLPLFPDLVHLPLDRTAVTDAGLIHITKLPKVGFISLNGTGITDEGLRTLAKCNPHLQTLLLRNTKTTREGILAFRKAHPQVQTDPDVKP